MKPALALLLILHLLSACAAVAPIFSGDRADAEDPVQSDLVRPQARPSDLSLPATPPSGARTAETLDTTSQEDRAAARATPPASAERLLGTTIASLGAPTEPGFWLKTPLVRRETQGRVVYLETGKSVQVTLIPIDGPPTAGSRLSLPALRLIEAPLTGLPEVQVFAGT